MSNPILLTVLGGYLGAGKTTLLNHILGHAGSRRLAVLVNDFGSINIDASLVESRTDDTLTLANGCICCSISAGFAEALSALAKRTPAPEHLIIEASGVADPTKISHFASLPPYRLDGIVVVADAETVRARAQEKYVGGQVLRQLRAADLIVLNKVDLVGEADRAAVEAWLVDQAPAARLLVARFGDVPPSVLVGLHGDVERSGAGDDHDHLHDHVHDHGDEYASASFVADEPISESSFRAMVEAWSPAVLRAKGIIHLADDPSRRHVFQLVGRRWSLGPDRDWRGERPQSRIVLIGPSGQIDGGRLFAALRRTAIAA